MLKTFTRGLLAAVALCAFVLPARATNYQDLWWNPSESGWGIQIVQQSDTLFLTWFIYDTAGNPTWVVSDGVTRIASGSSDVYRGRVISATGTYFGNPIWSPATPNLRGNDVTLTFTDARTATLTYTIDNVTVTKSITRQLLAAIDLSGFYYGGLTKNASGCTTPGLNGSGAVNSTLQVTHTTLTGAITINETSGSFCRFTGTAQQYGSIFEGSGNFTCSGDGTSGSWTGRNGTGGESTFAMKLAMRPLSDVCTIAAAIGGFKAF